MATGQPSYTNTFIAGFSAEMTEKLIVDFGRNYMKAPVFMLAGTTTTDLPQGYFNRQKPEAQARLIDDPAGFEWPDNTPNPFQENNRREFDYVQWNAKRYVYNTTVGDMELEYAAWDVKNQIVNDLGNQAVLNRMKQFYSLLNTSGNYLSGLTDTATNYGGGFWSAGSSSNRYIEKTIQSVIIAMDKASVNGINPEDLFLVVTPTVAMAMARSQEIADGLFRTTDYKEHLQYDLWKGQLSRYGLPPVLYGVNLVVDSWVKTTSRVGATVASTYTADTNSAYFVMKPGGIKSFSGGKSFGSVEFFVPKGKELVTEVLDQPEHKRKLIRCFDMFDCKLVAREASALVTNVLS